jgi:tetratricopeptide (TPR) repeat protein
MARALNTLGRFTEAVHEGKTALRLSDGKFAEIHFELGNAYFGLQKWPEAQQAYRMAAELDPKCAYSAYNVAVSYCNDGYRCEALAWYREVLRRNANVDNREEVQAMIDKLSRR